MREREKLPPGAWEDAEHGYIRTLDGYEAGTVGCAWALFHEETGITREKWEAMERDHRAMQALRLHEFDVYVNMECRWTVRTEPERCDIYGDDPAEAILAATGGEGE